MPQSQHSHSKRENREIEKNRTKAKLKPNEANIESCSSMSGKTTFSGTNFLYSSFFLLWGHDIQHSLQGGDVYRGFNPCSPGSKAEMSWWKSVVEQRYKLSSLWSGSRARKRWRTRYRFQGHTFMNHPDIQSSMFY